MQGYFMCRFAKTGAIRRMILTVLPVFLVIWNPCSMTAVRAQVQPPEVGSQAAVLMEASTGDVIYEKNADERRSPASITKIMTLILIFDALKEENIAGTRIEELSMGMSGDYLLAAQEGATHVRIGSAIFGSRAYAAPAGQAEDTLKGDTHS